MQTPTQQYGKKSENDAVRYLKKNGYRIIEKNYRTRLGEIDIIAKDDETIVFVEVKARRSTRYGHPKWAITPKKKRNMSMVALHYLKSTSQEKAKARFDVVTIHPQENAICIELIKNAFELAYG
jgi:putative endonuclease